jgi:hypothetical protein
LRLGLPSRRFCATGSRIWSLLPFSGSPLHFKGKIAKRYEDSVEWWPPTYIRTPDKFIHAGNFAGTGELFIDDAKVGEVDMPQTHNATFSLSEPFDVGIDNGTPVSTLYRDHNPYQAGTLDKVVFRLLG